MPWCRGCESHHVAPMLWRYATVKAGARLDSERRYTMGKPGRTPAASEAVRRFLGFYGPAKPGDFADWAGLAKPHAQRLWDEVAGDLAEVRVGKSKGWLMSEDVGALESPPAAEGIRLIPPGDPYLQKPNRRAARPGPRAAQAAVPARGEPRSGVEGRPPGRPVAGQGEGEEGGAHRREARPPPRAATSRRRPSAWRSCAEPPKPRSSSPDRSPGPGCPTRSFRSARPRGCPTPSTSRRSS